MRLSNRQKNLLRLHQFSAVYVIGPEQGVVYSTTEQAEALQLFLMNPRLGHNYQPALDEFVTLAQPVRLGWTASPADSMAVQADGWAFHWEYKLLARVWFMGRSVAEQVIGSMQTSHPHMRKSWINIAHNPGREMFDMELTCIARDLGHAGMDDLGMLERLEDLEFKLMREEYAQAN